MTSLKEYITHNARTRRRLSRSARRPLREDIGEVRTMSSIGINAATVALLAGINLNGRAARMNEFWRARSLRLLMPVRSTAET